MAITYNKPKRVDAVAWEFSGTSSATPPVPFRIYANGEKVADYSSANQAWSKVLHVPSGEGMLVEVLDNASAVPSPAFPGRVVINWVAVENATNYRVEEYVSAAWTEVITYAANGRSTFSHKSRWLEDQTTHQFRVIPISGAGNEGTALTFSFAMVRHPDSPQVTYTYNALNDKVTIAEAT